MTKTTVTTSSLIALRKGIEVARAEAYRLFMVTTDRSSTEDALDHTLDALCLAKSIVDDQIEELKGNRKGAGAAPAKTAAELVSDRLCHAIAFQRRVILGYEDTKRTVEPSLIRPARGGKLLLIAMKVEPGKAPEVRSYRVDRIQSVEVTDEAFEA